MIMKYDKEIAKRLKSSLFNLNVVHKGVASLKHGIESEYKWIEFYPTDFIYSFFAFNSLYNIDWDKSLRGRGEPRGYGYGATEKDKQGAYLDFCLSDDKFTDMYKAYFRGYVSRRPNVMDSLRLVKQEKYMRPNLRNDFVDACGQLIDDGNFNKEIVTVMVEFVYKVRNNIFHGAKNLSDMKNLYQQERLKIYASLVIALNQMAFSYLDYIIDSDTIEARIKGDFSSL